MSLSPFISCFYMTSESTEREQLYVLIRCNETVKRDEFEDSAQYHTQQPSWLFGASLSIA